ncbi:hypothetical [Yersinia pestis KIM10+]|uniref:Uncharacterized protein n=1 Tax=Yersinia pestis TaxID=632 RepID=Q8CKA3_YERPE|nr:hypothetical [Yersinia pestis KIM10+]
MVGHNHPRTSYGASAVGQSDSGHSAGMYWWKVNRSRGSREVTPVDDAGSNNKYRVDCDTKAAGIANTG